MRIGGCPLGSTDCAKDTCDECIEELLSSIEEKQKLINKLKEDALILNKQVAVRDKKNRIYRRIIKGLRTQNDNLENKLYSRNESYRGEVFDRDERKGKYR